MRPIDVIEGGISVLDRADVDTDQIIPKQFLKRVERSGFGEFLFYDWVRSGEIELEPNPILVTGRNFGCGSSREHAPWALTAWGIRAILSTSFADIFRSNALKNGLLPIAVEGERHRQLFGLIASAPDAELSVDLEAQVVHLPGDEDLPFDVDPFARTMLLAGTDEMGYLLSQEAAIAAWEAAHPARIDTRAGASA
jgi:3-isopropylmalate/(R)-2-methylmalate dehydratase small subunit